VTEPNEDFDGAMNDELEEAPQQEAPEPPAAIVAPAPADALAAPGGETAPAPPRKVAQKEYYSISEVCDLVGLRPHVLRYWETQFPLLNPSKNRSGNRVYQRKEIKLILYVKALLYEEKYTVEGAKQKLEQLRKGGELQIETKKALDKQMVALLRSEMQYLTEILTPTKPVPTR
jgi:DNA-binding transcriptional MerR regulator